VQRSTFLILSTPLATYIRTFNRTHTNHLWRQGRYWREQYAGEGRTIGPLSERRGGYWFESCCKKWDEVRTVIGPHPLVGDLWCSFRTHVQTVKVDSFHIIQVLHWPSTLLLRGCERVRQVILRYCCLQEEKTGSALIALYWGAFVLTLAGFEVFRKPLKGAAIACMWRKTKPWRIRCNFGSAR
jgi:hypothetical protein